VNSLNIPKPMMMVIKMTLNILTLLLPLLSVSIMSEKKNNSLAILIRPISITKKPLNTLSNTLDLTIRSHSSLERTLKILDYSYPVIKLRKIFYNQKKKKKKKNIIFKKINILIFLN
jgi:hypothetical protein